MNTKRDRVVLFICIFLECAYILLWEWQLVLMHGFWNGCELISACSPVAVQNGPQAIRKCLGAPKRLPTCDWDYYFLSCRNLFSPWWHSTAIKRPHCEGQVQACAILLGNTCTHTIHSSLDENVVRNLFLPYTILLEQHLPEFQYHPCLCNGSWIFLSLHPHV